MTIADFSDNVKADGIKFRPLKYLNFLHHFDFTQNLKKPLKTYLDRSRIAFIQMLRDIRPSSDCIVDGTMAPVKIAYKIVEYILINDAKTP